MANRLKLSSTLVFYWETGRLVCEDYLRRERFGVSPQVIGLLGKFASPISLKTLPEDEREMAQELRKMGLLVADGSPAEPLNGWHWGPAARHFFFGTKDAHIHVPRELRMARAKALLQESKRPAIFKEYPKARIISLDRPAAPPPLSSDALSKMRDTREFAPRPISQDQLSAILSGGFGARGTINAKPFGEVLVKGYPSAGNCHPLEAYVVIAAVEGLARGLYHYNVKNHALELLKRGDFRRTVKSVANEQAWVKNAAAYFLMTAIPERTSFKYRHDYFLRTIFADVGHASQSLYYGAAAVGLGACTTYTLRHSLAEKFLGIDGIQESFLALTLVGSASKSLPHSSSAKP